LNNGKVIDRPLVTRLVDEEVQRLGAELAKNSTSDEYKSALVLVRRLTMALFAHAAEGAFVGM
jgi:hypothetical protein